MPIPAVLVDTSIWIRAFAADPAVTPQLVRLLRASMAHTHPWSQGEMLLGSGVPEEYVEPLGVAPWVSIIDDATMLRFVHEHRLQRSGIGWVDLQLLAAAHQRGIALWTADTALKRATRRVKLPALHLGRW